MEIKNWMIGEIVYLDFKVCGWKVLSVYYIIGKIVDVDGKIWVSMGGWWNLCLYVCIMLGYEVEVDVLVKESSKEIYKGSMIDLICVYLVW